MPTVPMTQAWVDKLRYDPNGKANQIYHDENLTGLTLQAARTGRHAWGIQHHLRPRKVIGHIDKWTYKKAKIEAREFLAQLGKGIDPWGKRLATDDPTLRKITEEQLSSTRKNERERGPRRKATKDDTWDQFERNLYDWLDQPFTGISRQDVNERFEIIKNGEWISPLGRKVGTLQTAQQTFSYLRTVFKYAMRVYDCPDPTIVIEHLLGGKSKGTKHRALSDDELSVVAKCFTAWEGNPRIPPMFRFMLFTGLRIKPVLEMRWEYIDRDLIVLPEEQSKANRIRAIPITPQIRRELDTLRDLAYDEWLFPSDSASGHMTTRNWGTVALNNACGIKTTNHSFRYTFATTMENLGIDPQVQAMLMDHSAELTITDRYRMQAFVERVRPSLIKLNKVLDQKLRHSRTQ